MDCDICNKLTRLSTETWNRIGFSRTRPGLKIYETTLTQNLLFSLRQFQEDCDIHSLNMYEATNESINGNDIELIVQTPRGYVKIPTQAKLLYKNLKYVAINHRGTTGYQVDDLISYASSIGGIPMYLLYNYVPHHTDLIEHGCTMVKADYIRNHFSPARIPTSTRWKIPSFNDLHSHARPWHAVICNLLSGEFPLNNNQIFDNIQNLGDTTQWRELTTIQDIEPIELTENNNTTGYQPRFRVIISQQDNNQ